MAVARPSTSSQQGFPAMSTPLIMDTGGPAAPWYQLWRTFWVRTGSQQGIDGAALTQASSDQALMIAIQAGQILATS